MLALMAEGRSNAGIADALVVTGGTVEKHVASIFDKVGLPPAEADNRRVLAVLRYLSSWAGGESPGGVSPGGQTFAQVRTGKAGLVIGKLPAVAVVALLSLPLAGCRERPQRAATAAAVDYEARRACATLWSGYGGATTVPRRLALADAVTRWSAGSDNPAVVSRGAAMGRSADESTPSWRAAADRLMKTCKQAGWRPRR